MMLPQFIFASIVTAVFSAIAAEPPVIQLWPKGAPGSEGKAAPEVVQGSSVSSVHRPSLTVYLPARETATGAAVIVCPGGGHRVLAIEHEGYNVGKWLAEHGIAGFVLKYRLARETNSTYKIETHALADTQRAIRLVRSRAQEWGIDPARVGVMGFSAGGELAALSSMRFSNDLEDKHDPVDKLEARPAFQALIYSGNSKSILPEKGAPPAFIVCGYGDRSDIAEGMADVYLRFKKAGVPAELHIYSNAGHGFGLRTSNRSSSGKWPERFQEWLVDRKMLGPQ